jgi:hypothetical protein
VTHANAPLRIEGLQRPVAHCRTCPIAHVADVGVLTRHPVPGPLTGAEELRRKTVPDRCPEP